MIYQFEIIITLHNSSLTFPADKNFEIWQYIFTKDKMEVRSIYGGPFETRKCLLWQMFCKKEQLH